MELSSPFSADIIESPVCVIQDIGRFVLTLEPIVFLGCFGGFAFWSPPPKNNNFQNRDATMLAVHIPHVEGVYFQTFENARTLQIKKRFPLLQLIVTLGRNPRSNNQ